VLKTAHWEVQVKPFFTHLTARGRVPRRRFIVSFATTLFFYFGNTRSDMDSVIFRIMLFFSCTLSKSGDNKVTRENQPLVIVHRTVHHFTSSDLESLNVAETHVRFDIFDAICHHLSH